MNLIGKAFGRDRVMAKIADGGMGSVWRTEHSTLSVARALKVMPEGFAEKPDLVERFQREAQVMAQLHHPHIVQVYDFGCQEGIYYLIMEYVPGGSLRAKLREANGPLEWQEALRILDQICEGLEYAHGKGVIHRDIKPENILIDEQGRVKIADFGLGKIMENVVKTRSASLLVKEDKADLADVSEQSIGRLPTRLTPGELTMLGQVVGTLEYMSPEQRRGEVVDARSDIYSLGVVLFEMLTGRPPAGMELPSESRSGLPTEVDEMVKRLLSPISKRLGKVDEVRKQTKEILSFEVRSVNGPKPDARTIPRSGNNQGQSELRDVTLRRAAEEEDCEAQFNLGLMCAKKNDLEQAAQWYRRAADGGHVRARGMVAGMYFRGDGLERDYDKAVQYYRKAAEQGEAESQNTLGVLFFEGRIVAQNYCEAAKWFRRAAEQGRSDAQGNLGALYEKGLGVPENHEESVKWYRLAAEQGDATRQYDIGRCLDLGKGISENKAEAIKWYRKAAEQGHARAQLALGLAYAKGTVLEENLDEALAWIEKSVAKGHEPAKEAREVILKKRDLVQKLSEAKCEKAEAERKIQEAQALCSQEEELQARFDELQAKYDELKAKFDGLNAKAEEMAEESPELDQIAAEMTQTANEMEQIADEMTKTADDITRTAGQAAQIIGEAKSKQAKAKTLVDQVKLVGHEPNQPDVSPWSAASSQTPAASETVRYSAKLGDELIFQRQTNHASGPPSPGSPTPPTPIRDNARTISMGPVGRVRKVWLVVLLSVVTGGFYTIVWYGRLWGEARTYANGRNGVKIMPTGLALCLLFACPIMLMFGSAQLGLLIRRTVQDFDPMLLFGAACLLGYVWLFAAAFVLPRLILRMRLAKGISSSQAKDPGYLGWLFLVPYVGPFWWVGRVQNAFNEFWQREAN